jgi:plasmid stabilization system protein ParE
VEYKVIWSAFAETQLDEIYEYYSQKASIKVSVKIIRNLILRSEQLIKNPYAGVIEEFLENRNETYKYIIYTNYKIIYSVDKEQKLIKVADVFDTRQNPIKLKRNK